MQPVNTTENTSANEVNVGSVDTVTLHNKYVPKCHADTENESVLM